MSQDINIGAISEALNNKADIDLNNTDFRKLENNNNVLSWDGQNVITYAGIIAAFAGTTPPTGWLKCDGSAVSRTTYAALFAVIGTTYGAGNSSTTFNLPNLIGRVPFGMTSEYIGQSSNGVLPNITGKLANYAIQGTDASGAFAAVDTVSSSAYDSSNHSRQASNASFDASRSNSIYGNGWYSGARVVPASIGMTYCIKY